MNPILQMGKNDTELLFLPKQLPLTGTREMSRGKSSKMQSIKLCSLGQDWNNCLVLDVEQTSLPSQCSTCLKTYRENLSSSFFFPCCYIGFTRFLLHKKKKVRQDPIYPQNKRTGIHPLELIGSSRESTFFVWLICRTHCNILPWRWGDRSISHTNLKRFTS